MAYYLSEPVTFDHRVSLIPTPLGLLNPPTNAVEIQALLTYRTAVFGSGSNPQALRVQAIFDRVSHVEQYCTPFPTLRDSHKEHKVSLYLNFISMLNGSLRWQGPSVVLREKPDPCSTCKVVSVRLSLVCELHPWAAPSIWLVKAGFRRNLHLESSLNDLSAGPLDYGSGIFRLCSPLEERHIWSSTRRPARGAREGYGRPSRGSSRSEGCGLSGTLRRSMGTRAVSCVGSPRRCLWWRSAETGRCTRWRRRVPERAGPWAYCPSVAATTTSRLSGWARVSGGRWKCSSEGKSA